MLSPSSLGITNAPVSDYQVNSAYITHADLSNSELSVMSGRKGRNKLVPIKTTTVEDNKVIEVK